MVERTERADVVVLGGAFAGSATALLLKRADPALRVIVVEKEAAFDRKVGESAIEVSAWFMTRMLGLSRHLSLDHLPKYGLRFWFENERVRTLADASELGNRFQTRLPSYHIDRAVLDEHVHGLARSAGAEVLRPARAVEVEPRPGADSRVVVSHGEERVAIEARWLVDATGRASWLARKVAKRIPIHEHPTHTVWARFRGLRDFDGDWVQPLGTLAAVRCSRGLATNHFCGPGWWVWVIPLPGGDVSVGIVWDERIFSLPAGGSLESRFDRFVAGHTGMREMMEGATRVEERMNALSSLPYRFDHILGDGWASVGDAAGFLDPFYSPGLDWAGITITAAVDVIRRERAGEDVSARIAQIDRTSTTGFRRWYEALYRDKYWTMGDAELLHIAFRMDTSMYYFGIVRPPVTMGPAMLRTPFSEPVSLPFYLMIRFVNRRLASIAKLRLRWGRYGRANAGRRYLLKGFAPSPGMLGYLPGVLVRWLAVEIAELPWRVRDLMRRRRAPEGVPADGKAASRA